MKKLLSVLAACLAVCLTACSSGGSFGGEILSKDVERTGDTALTYAYTDGAEPPAAYNTFANTISGFELKLFRAAYAEGISALTPYQAVSQLGLLANGAKGDTRTEILLALGVELDLDNLNACCSYFESRMENVGRISVERQSEEKTAAKATISLDKALLVNNTTDVRRAFLQTNADFYGDEILRFDFGSKDVVRKLDDYLYYSAPPLDSGDSIVAVSGMQMEDSWLTPYEQGCVVNSNLHSQELFMQSDRAQGVLKYTEKNPLKALFIMPDGDLDDYIKSFDSVEYHKLLDSIDVTKRQGVQLMPFTLPSTDADVTAPLQKAGLYTLFDEGSDFGNMAHTDGLRLNQVYSTAPPLFFSAAGIATEQQEQPDVLHQETALDPEAYKDDVVFNKPFLFLLIDNETEIPVYIAAVTFK